MRKRNVSLFLSVLLCMMGTVTRAQDNERLSFGVISDVHFENNVGEGAMVKVPRALKNLTSHKALDAIAVVGDLANSGKASEYELLTSVFSDKENFTNPVGTLLFLMGNHDNMDGNGTVNYQKGLSSFNGGKDYPLHQYKVIKGYPFITISMRTSSNNDTGNAATGTAAYPQDVVDQLEAWLEQASKECPGKPIFVFTHVPPRWTVYGSWPEWENGSAWGMKVLNPVLNKYPQAVVFAGHSHYPLGDPRSIHQGTNPKSDRLNYYTVINTGSTTYSEVNPGAVNAGIHPEGYTNVTEGMIVSELPNGDIDITRYDTYRNMEIGAGQHWVLKAPFDGSKFEYADIRDADDNPDNVTIWNGLPAPAFTKSAEIIVKPTAFDATVFIPQATDNECVFRYRVRLSKNGLVISEKFIFSQFYLSSDTPDPLKYEIPNLTSNTGYQLEVVAYDSYDNASYPLTATFKTPEASGDNTVSEPDGQWKFQDEEDLLKTEEGNLSLTPCIVGRNSVTVAESLEEAEIRATEGPAAENKAILVPKNSALRLNRVKGTATQEFTVLMDIRMKDAAVYNGLLQTNKNNANDGDLFIYRNQIGMNALGGYFGEIKDNTWYRIVMLNRDGKVCVFVDGQMVIEKATSDLRWELDPWGFYLFCDNDGEMTDTEVAEVAFWEKALSDNQVRSLSGLSIEENDEEEPYLNVNTTSVKLVNEKTFTVKVDANVSFTFDLPEWIECADAVPFKGARDYTFQIKSDVQDDYLEGTIRVVSEEAGIQEVEVVVFLGNEIPEVKGAWTFDNQRDLLDGGGYPSILQAAFKGSDGPEKTTDLASVGIVPSEGPTEDNGAISIPKDAYLWFTPNADNAVLRDYTILFDIKPADLNGYKAIFQHDVTNKEDASLFIKNNQVGLSGAIGYVGNLQLDKWYRLLFVVKGSRAILYLDGEKVGESSVSKDVWTITNEALLFADNNSEEGLLDVAEIRFWDIPFSANLAKRLGNVYKDADEYFAVQTTGVRLLDQNDFTVSVNSNVPFTFELPEWIEPVDTAFVSGEKEYRFRATSLDEAGRRNAVIEVNAEYFPTQEVNILQIKTGEALPESTGCWTFDNPANLMEGTGTATMKAAFETEAGPQTTDDPSEAQIEAVEGPTEENGAITMPVPAYLMMSNNTGFPELTDYTILMDVRPLVLEGYHALLQTNPRNNTDGGFYIKNGMIGLNNNGLGYNGLMQYGKWHRIVFVVKEGFAYAYLDGKRVGQSTRADFALWTLLPDALLFADDNGEDGYNEVAEVRFWDVPLTDAHVQLLGGVEQGWIDDPMPAPAGEWTFDNKDDLLEGTGTATLRAAVKGAEGPQATDDLAAAGIVPAQGPTSRNGAITVPVDTYLQFIHNQDEPDQRSYSFMMDIRPKNLSIYNALFQNKVLNNKDASLFINKEQKLGINVSGLGYGGKLEQGKWHRIIFIVENCSITTFLDGNRVGSSTSANEDKWLLHDVAYFFADEDGEEGIVDIAELRYWDTALAGIHAQELGGVETEDIDGLRDIDPSVSDTTEGAVYDLSGRKINARLKKGIYIMNGKKVVR